jgi:hypothetical protein
MKQQRQSLLRKLLTLLVLGIALTVSALPGRASVDAYCETGNVTCWDTCIYGYAQPCINNGGGFAYCYGPVQYTCYWFCMDHSYPDCPLSH